MQIMQTNDEDLIKEQTHNNHHCHHPAFCMSKTHNDKVVLHNSNSVHELALTAEVQISAKRSKEKVYR